MTATENFELCGCLVEAPRNRISCDSGQVILEPRVMDVLVALARHHPEVLSRDRLIEIAWEDRPVSDEVVNRCVFELRKAFRELGVNQELIETVRKRGYRLAVAPQTALFATPSKSGSQAWIRGIFTLAIIGGLAIAWWLSGPQSAQPLSIPGHEAQVLEVLPIEFDQENPQARAVGLALQQGIVDAISHQPAVIVRKPATLSGVSTGPGVPEPQGARLRMNLDARTYGGWDVTANVEDDEAGALWNTKITLEEDLANLVVAQRELSTEVMALLNARLSPDAACSWPADVKALELHFQARDLVNHRGEENIRQAISLLREVIDRQPDFAYAWALLGRANEILPVYIEGEAGVRERARTDPLSRAAYQQALELCPGHALAYQKVGPVPEYAGHNEWIQNHYRMRRAFELDPNDGEAARHYANIMFRVGRLSEWRRLLEHAGRVDPHNPRILLELCFMSLHFGELNQAAEYLQAARSLGSKLFYPMMEHQLALDQGDWETAHKLIDQLPTEMQAFSTALTKHLQSPGDPATRKALVEALRSQMALSADQGATLAHIIAVRIGEFDLAFEAWTRMRKDAFNLMTLWMPEALEFRKDPRFFDMVDGLGLVEYWNHTGDPDWCSVQENRISCKS